MSASPATLGHRRALRFWGWGYADEVLDADEETRLADLVSLLGGGSPVAAPTLADFTLPAPRITPPASLQDICSASPYERLSHALGKSLADSLRR